MAITTADGWFAAAKQRLALVKTSTITATGGPLPYSLWSASGSPGAGTLSAGNTTNGVLYTSSTTGAPAINAFGSGATGYLAAGRYRNTVVGVLTLYDKLYGLGAITTALATTTPTSQPSISGRVPGGTDYSGCELLLEFTASMAATATTVTITYTNQSGTTARTTGAVSINGTNFSASRVVSMPLQAGDTGVQKIETVVVGGVAGAGSFNAVIARRLADFDARVINSLDAQAWDMIGGPVVFATSCLWMVGNADSTSTGTPTLALDIING